MKTKKKTCVCKNCGRSSNYKSECLYEDKEQMCYCPTYIHPPKKKEAKKDVPSESIKAN